MTEPHTQPPAGEDLRLFCPACERANAPNRAACLYCGTALPIVDPTRQRPAFRQLEDWEQGYNVICLPYKGGEAQLARAAEWLKTSPETLGNLLESGQALPLVRVATEDEALLVCHTMRECGLETGFVPDREMRLAENPPRRVRRLEGDEKGVTLEPIGGLPPAFIAWDDLTLFVGGRLFSRQINTEERAKGRKSEQEIVDSSETGHDELVLDVYGQSLSDAWRIPANGFDYSCLREAKSLLAEDNFERLCHELKESAPQAFWDDSFTRIRALLSHVWPPQKQTGSRGWQRSRGSNLTRQITVTQTNEEQFNRYSRLLYILKTSENE
jgi:hypothetical protein